MTKPTNISMSNSLKLTGSLDTSVIKSEKSSNPESEQGTTMKKRLITRMGTKGFMYSCGLCEGKVVWRQRHIMLRHMKVFHDTQPAECEQMMEECEDITAEFEEEPQDA